MLRINKLIDYGTLVLSMMATRPGHYFSAADLADSLNLGRPTVSKILKQLTQDGLVKSMRGAKGGYCLTRQPEDITLIDIIDALDDQPFGLTECSATPGVCAHEPACHIRINWQRISGIVRATLNDVSVADLIPKSRVPPKPNSPASAAVKFEPTA